MVLIWSSWNKLLTLYNDKTSIDYCGQACICSVAGWVASLFNSRPHDWLSRVADRLLLYPIDFLLIPSFVFLSHPWIFSSCFLPVLFCFLGILNNLPCWLMFLLSGKVDLWRFLFFFFFWMPQLLHIALASFSFKSTAQSPECRSSNSLLVALATHFQVRHCGHPGIKTGHVTTREPG